MKPRTLIILAAALALGGFALYDYYSPESTRVRAFYDVERLAPDQKLPACVFVGDHARPFTAVLKLDQRPEEMVNTVSKSKGLMKHDCIRGSPMVATLGKLVVVLGDYGVPFYSAVIEKYP